MLCVDGSGKYAGEVLTSRTLFEQQRVVPDGWGELRGGDCGDYYGFWSKGKRSGYGVEETQESTFFGRWSDNVKLSGVTVKKGAVMICGKYDFYTLF